MVGTGCNYIDCIVPMLMPNGCRKKRSFLETSDDLNGKKLLEVPTKDSTLGAIALTVLLY